MSRKHPEQKGRHAPTRGIEMLEQAGVPFRIGEYEYVEKGGAARAAEALGVDLHHVVKTLVMEDGDGAPVLILMHGDQQVSTKKAARALGVKRIRPCSPEAAERHTGYKVGGISPFGVRKAMPVLMQSTIAELDRVWINAGRRGLLVEVAVPDLMRLLDPVTGDIRSESS